jgi:hypothetical protein
MPSPSKVEEKDVSEKRLGGALTVKMLDGGTAEIAYVIEIEELCEWLARKAEKNAGLRTYLHGGIIKARIIDRKRPGR